MIGAWPRGLRSEAGEAEGRSHLLRPKNGVTSRPYLSCHPSSSRRRLGRLSCPSAAKVIGMPNPNERKAASTIMYAMRAMIEPPRLIADWQLFAASSCDLIVNEAAEREMQQARCHAVEP